MKAAIVILNYNLPELTDSLCEDLIQRSRCDYDLFVIENGSAADNLSKHCTHRLEENRWISGGFNYGVSAALDSGEYDAVWLLHNDVSFDQEGDVLSYLLGCLDRFPRIGIIQPAWDNEWVVDGDSGWTSSAKGMANPLVPAAGADPLGMMFRTDMILDVCPRLGRNHMPLWDESNKRNHGNAQLTQLAGYRKGWATAVTTTFTSSEIREPAETNSLEARGEDDASWKSAGAIEREEWLRRRWRDASFFGSPNLFAKGDVRGLMRNAGAYARMWLDLGRSSTSGKACWLHALELCKREYRYFMARYPEYAEMKIGN